MKEFLQTLKELEKHLDDEHSERIAWLLEINKKNLKLKKQIERLKNEKRTK